MSEIVQRSQLRKAGTITYAAGGTERKRIEISGKVRRIVLDLSATLNVTGAGGTVITHQPLSLIRNINVWANETVLLKTGRGIDFRHRAQVFSKVNTEQVAAAGVASYPIRAKLPLYFVPPRAIGSRFPVDSILDLEPTTGGFKTLEIEIQWGDESNLLAAGTKAFTTNPSIDVLVDIDRWAKPPSFLYKELATEKPVLAAANTALEVPLLVEGKREYHHLIIAAEDQVATSGRALVSTAFNQIELKQNKGGSESNIVGPMSGHQLQHEYDELFTPPGGIITGLYPLVFQGRYDGMVNYNLNADGVNSLWFLLNHDAFATSGYIRVLQGTFERIR